MFKMRKVIKHAIYTQKVYKSPETKQLWIVKPNNDVNSENRNYIILHQHPGRNIHKHAYAASVSSAVKKITQHETWTIEKSGRR